MSNIVLWMFEGGYLFQHLATLCQIMKMIKRKNSECISLETNILFLIGAICRTIWIFDSLLTSFFLTYIELILAISTLGYAIYLHQKYKVRNFYSNEVRLPTLLKLYVLLPVVIILSLLFHPGDEKFSLQIFVSLNIYSEAIGLLPQFYIIKKSKDSGDLSELYIVFLGIARFFRLMFWIKSFIDGDNFLSLIIPDFFHCLILSGFIYNAIKNWSGNGLPTTFSELKNNKNKKMF